MSEYTNRMALPELEKTREFQRLTPKQKMFVQTYVSVGMIDGDYDAISATASAYQCKSREVARIMSYALLANINIVAVLNRHFGTEPIDSFLATLERAIHNKKLTTAQVQALKLYCDVMKFDNKLPTQISPEALSEVKPTPKKSKKPRKISGNPLPSNPTYLNPEDI